MSGLYTQSQIASQYGITQSIVSQIVKCNDNKDLIPTGFI